MYFSLSNQHQDIINDNKKKNQANKYLFLKANAKSNLKLFSIFLLANHPDQQRAHVKSALTRNEGIVSRMLSDQNTLLAMCLRRGKLAQATQVVKVCKGGKEGLGAWFGQGVLGFNRKGRQWGWEEFGERCRKCDYRLVDGEWLLADYD